MAWLADRFNFETSDVDSIKFDARGNYSLYFNSGRKDVAYNFFQELSKRGCHAEYHESINAVLLKKDQRNNILNAGNTPLPLPDVRGTQTPGTGTGTAYVANWLRAQLPSSGKMPSTGGSARSLTNEEIKDNETYFKEYEAAINLAKTTGNSNEMVCENTFNNQTSRAKVFIKWASSETGYHIRSLNKEDLEAVVNRFCSRFPLLLGRSARSQLKPFIYWKTKGEVQLRFNVVSAKTLKHAELIASNGAILERFVNTMEDKVRKKEIAPNTFYKKIRHRFFKFVKECNELGRDLNTMSAKDLVDERDEYVKKKYSHTTRKTQIEVTLAVTTFINWFREVKEVASDEELWQASMADNGNSHPTKRHKNNAVTRDSVKATLNYPLIFA